MLLELGLVWAVLVAAGSSRGRGRAKGIVIAESAASGRGRGRGQAKGIVIDESAVSGRGRGRRQAIASDKDKSKGKGTPTGKGKNKRMPRSPTPSESSDSSSSSEEDPASSPVVEGDSDLPRVEVLGTDVLATMVMGLQVVESWWSVPDSKKSYLSHFSRRKVLCERIVDLDGIANGFVNQLFQHRRWRPILNLAGRIYPRLVQIFYANFSNWDTGDWRLYTNVLGVDIEFSAYTVAHFLGLRRVPSPSIPSDSPPQTPQISDVYATLCGGPIEVKGVLRASSMTEDYQVLHKVVCNTILLTTHQSEVSVERARFLYAMGVGDSIDLASLIVQLVYQASHITSTSTGLPFGVLISNFLLSKGVPADIQFCDQQRAVSDVTLKQSLGQRKGKQARLAPDSSTSTMPPPVAPTVPAPAPLTADQFAQIMDVLTELCDRMSRIEAHLAARDGPLPPLPPRGRGGGQ